MPSRATLVESETEIAALCLLRTSQDLIDNKVPMVAGLCDHGTRRDVHHFPTSIHYPVQVKGQWRMKHATLSIDEAGHTADDCADAWEQSLNRLPGVDFFAHRINISNNDGASGGGAESSDGSSAADSTAVDDDTETNDNTEPSDSTVAGDDTVTNDGSSAADSSAGNDDTATNDSTEPSDSTTVNDDTSNQTISTSCSRRNKRKLDIYLGALTTDRGGGGGFTKLFPRMILRGVMPKHSIGASSSTCFTK
jgi:hypothetical protein